MTDGLSMSERDVEMDDLRAGLAAAEDILRAIRGGEVDAVMVTGEHGEQVHTLGVGEHRFRQLAESLPQLVWTCRADGWCEYLSPQWVAYTGIPESEQLGEGWLNQLHPADRDRSIAAWSAAVATASSVDIEFRIRRNDGVYRWFSTRAVPLRDCQGRVTQWVGSNTDVEDLKHSEVALRQAYNEVEQCVARRTKELREANENLLQEIASHKLAVESLRESERLSQATLDALSAHIAVLDETGVIIAANRAWRAFAAANPPLSAPVNEGANYLAVCDVAIGPDAAVAAGVAAQIRTVLAGAASEIEIEYPCHSPAIKRWFVCRVSRFSGSGALRVVVAHENITVQKRAEETLRAREQEFRSLAESMPQIVWVTRADGWNIYFNQQWMDYTGLTQEQSNGHGWNTPFHPDDKQRAWDAWQRATQHNDTYSVECRLRRADGTYHWWLIRGVPIRNSSGEILKWFGTCTDIEDIKRTEAALREAAQMIEGIINAMPVRVFWKDKSLTYLGCNAAFARDAGFADPKDVIGKDDFQMGWRAQAEAYRADDRAVIASSRAKLLIEQPQTTPTGDTITLLTSKLPLRGANGEINGVIGTYMDITEHKRADALARALSSRQEAILAAIPDIIMEVDCNKVYTWANRAGVEFYGEDVIGKEVAFYFADEQDTYRKVQPLFDGDEHILHLESWQRRKDGEKRLLAWRCRGLKDAQGRGTGALSTAHDITAIRQADDYRAMGVEVLQIVNEPGDLPDIIQRVIGVLKARTGSDAVGLRLQDGDDFPYTAQDGFSKEFLLTENTLLERAADGGVCRDKDGKVCLECTCGLVISGKTDPANPLFTRGGSSWTNDSFPLLDLPSDQDPRMHPRNTCIHQGYASVALIPIRTNDNIVGLIQFNDRRKGRFTLATVELLENIAAHIGSALMRKRAEEEKSKLEDQLRQAQKMEAVGRLAGGVAHDFNNLLMGIMGYAQLCRDMVGPDHVIREYLDEITHDAERSAEITQQLLAFARKQTIAPKVLDLNDAVAGMLKLLRRLIGEDIKLAWRPGKDLRSVKLDPSQVDQILANLCVNARDAIAGVGEIMIETGSMVVDADYGARHPEANPGEYVFLVVRDNGRGMDRETLAQIFEPFFTTKSVGEGTGLGLATVYGIVKQNHGFINVYSEPGQGTSFNIYLPLFISTEAVPIAAEMPIKPPRGSETVLLVEDEKSIRVTTQVFLEDLGYCVLVAEEPEKALLLAAEHPGEIHLLITDVIMPRMSGRDLASRLLEVRTATKCLFISGFTADVIAQRGILEGGVNFLPKPFGRDALARTVRDVLDGKTGRAAAVPDGR